MDLDPLLEPVVKANFTHSHPFSHATDFQEFQESSIFNRCRSHTSLSGTSAYALLSRVTCHVSGLRVSATQSSVETAEDTSDSGPVYRHILVPVVDSNPYLAEGTRQVRGQ